MSALKLRKVWLIQVRGLTGGHISTVDLFFSRTDAERYIRLTWPDASSESGGVWICPRGGDRIEVEERRARV
jgi:hypothetical protein